MKTDHILTKLFTLCLGILITSACNSFEENKSALDWERETVEGKTTIVMAIHNSYMWDGTPNPYYLLKERFELQNPDINIQFVSEDKLVDHRWIRQGSAESAELLVQNVDVFVDVFQPTNSLDANTLFYDLSSFIEQDPEIDSSDFYHLTFDRNAGYEGLRTLPLTSDYLLIHYNKDHFDAAGLPYPSAGWTWEEFKETTEKLTIQQDNQVIQYGFSQGWGGFEDLIAARAGKHLYDTTTNPPTLSLNDPAIQEATEWVSEFYNLPGVVKPALKREKWDEWLSEPMHLVFESEASMYIHYLNPEPWPSSSINVGVVPFPVSDIEKPNTPALQTGMMSISTHSEYPEEAWQWVKFLLFESQVLPQEDLWGIPSLRSAAEQDSFVDQFEVNELEALQFATNNSFSRIRPFYYYDEDFGKGVDEAFVDGIEEILANGRNFDENLIQFQDSFNSNFLNSQAE